MTLAFLFVETANKHLPKRLVRKIKGKYGISPEKELKGSGLTINQLEFFSGEVVKLERKNPELTICSMTVLKKNVKEHIRADSNKLYNYMINLAILDLIDDNQTVLFSPDPRAIKVSSGDSMVDYLQTQLWFEKNKGTRIVEVPHESHNNLNLQFIDVVSNIIWKHHELGISSPYKVILPVIQAKQLFFR